MEDEEGGAQLRERLRRADRESRFLLKDSDDRKVMEEVFDQATMLALKELLARRDITELNGVVRAGKEARVYWGVAPDGSPRAVKIYLMSSAEFRKRRVYITGDRRFGKLPSGSRELINLWAQKEFKNMQTALRFGIRVPRPYAVFKNVLVMEFIGEPPLPAPTLAEAEVDEDDYRWVFRTVRRLFSAAGLVHADLSEYNIFKFRGQKTLFDMGSAVLASHPQAAEFLRRDVFNMVRFFGKRGIEHGGAEERVEEILK